MLKKLAAYLAAEIKAEFLRLIEEELAKVGFESVSAPQPSSSDATQPSEG